MSLEAALDEERRDVIALLEGRALPSHSKNQQASNRGVSPAGMPQSPVRSMLDFDDLGIDVPPPTIRHASIAGQGVGVTTPGGPPIPRQTVRSMLDTTSPPPSKTEQNNARPRAPLDSPPYRPYSNQGVEKDFNFEMVPTDERGALPKRVTQGGKRDKKAKGGIFGSMENGRSDVSRALLGHSHKSRSPVPANRSKSPGLNTNTTFMKGANQYISETGQVIDMNSAYRRLSDGAILRSRGALSNLPIRKGSDPSRGEQLAPDGGIRLTKDYNDEGALESSDDSSDSSDEGWNADGQRGRVRTRSDDGELVPELGFKEGRQPKSLLAAAEQERKAFQANQSYRSLLEPEVKITGPAGETVTATKRMGIHPHTSFENGSASGVSTPGDSDNEAQMDEIRRAQRLKLNISQIKSVSAAHRTIRQIVRGEYPLVHAEGKAGLRRQRVFLVATDLSDEAAYALEWTIGTVLKDGDTLLAVYAVDNDTGTGAGPTEESSGIEIGEGAKAMKETAYDLRTLNNTETLPVSGAMKGALQTSTSRLKAESPAGGRSRTPQRSDLSHMKKAERERWLATEAITDRCIALLRKTRLQVRIVIEVFNCRSPKHMLIEVIDCLDPTLVVLGSRGRSALKGVLLGSFSNYLVTKSSVPVMVARKKLRSSKQEYTFRRANLKLSNVLQGPSSTRKLESAKIDKVMARAE